MHPLMVITSVIVVLLTFLSEQNTYYVEAVMAPCSQKGDDTEVFRVGMIIPTTSLAVSVLLAAEHAVNGNTIMKELGCFDFNITLFNSDTPADTICSNNDAYPFVSHIQTLDIQYNSECPPESICFPNNTLWLNDECDSSWGKPAAEAMLDDDVVAVIGPACSGTTIAAEPVMAKDGAHVPLISPTATSSALSNATVFPYFFRTIGPDSAQAKAMVDIATALNVTKAAVIADASIYSSAFAMNIIGFLPDVGIELVTHQVVGGNQTAAQTEALPIAIITSAMEAIASSGAEAIFNTVSCATSKEILELAPSFNLTTSTNSNNCSIPFIMPAANSQRAVCLPSSSSDGDGAPDTTLLATELLEGSGPAHGEFVRLRDERAETGSCDNGDPLIPYYDFAFDALLAIAVAIRSIIASGDEVSGESIAAAWSDPKFGFVGASGNVSFGGQMDGFTYGAHDRPTSFQIVSYENGSYVPRGFWDPRSSPTATVMNTTQTLCPA